MYLQIVYILDQVRALESEMLLRIKQQGLNITPRILIVSVKSLLLLSIISITNLNLIVLIRRSCIDSIISPCGR